ncbi:MAG: hypothetical protein J3K34DRAFT_444264 [Monoraphidium minutum]|nr:MAG: hypothetical protein J3K34DRAFT_444264 [Monoraphidium minutum]
MALRQGVRSLARLAGKGLPQRGGGGGPIKYAPEPNKPVPLWDEMWWDDGLMHSQPVLDGVGEPTLFTPAQSALQLAVAMGVMISSVYAAKAAWSEDKAIYVPPQYPPEVLEAYKSRGKLQA